MAVHSYAPAGSATSSLAASILLPMGIAPEVDECALCGSKKITSISVDAGGFLCASCSNNARDDLNLLRQFRLVNKAQLENYDILKQFGPYSYGVAEYLYGFIKQYLSISLSSMDFLKEIIVLK